MFMALVLGCMTVFISMGIQVAAVVYMLRYLLNILAKEYAQPKRFGFDAYIIGIVLVMLFFGHLIQVGLWAILFMQLGEFSDFQTAFYHSTVNFASLGYGDIVMSEQWRLLGAIEASNGVLMFGLSAGTLFSVMSRVFARHEELKIPPPKGSRD